MMKRLFAITMTIVLPFAVGCAPKSAPSPETAVDATEAAFNSGNGPTVTFSVDGMMCEQSCAKNVQKILADQSGVEEAKVDFEAKTATCVIDKEKFDPTAAIAELADKDFTAVVKN